MPANELRLIAIAINLAGWVLIIGAIKLIGGL